jgi:hypothetical protein
MEANRKVQSSLAPILLVLIFFFLFLFVFGQKADASYGKSGQMSQPAVNKALVGTDVPPLRVMNRFK